MGLVKGPARAIRRPRKHPRPRSPPALDTIPRRAAIAEQLTTIFQAEFANHHDLVRRGGKLFALRTRPGAQQPSHALPPRR